MAHWAVEHAFKTLIGALVLAALSGIAYVAVVALKVPNLELQLKKHDEQLAVIKVSLLTLMQKTGNPPAKEDLEKIMSSVGDLGKTKAELIEAVKVEEGSGRVAAATWIPTEFRSNYTTTIPLGESIKDKEKIARLIAGGVVADKGVTWHTSGKNLKMHYGTDSIFTLTPIRKVSAQEVDSWATTLNTLGKEVGEFGKKGSASENREAK